MTRQAIFEIPGTPASQGSMSFYGRGRVAHPPKVVAWRELAVAVMRVDPQQYFDTPVSVRLEALFTRPPSHLRLDGSVRPSKARAIPTLDLDKIERAAGDALEAAGVVKNDSLIQRWDAVKCWTPADPRLLLVVTEVES